MNTDGSDKFDLQKGKEWAGNSLEDLLGLLVKPERHHTTDSRAGD